MLWFLGGAPRQLTAPGRAHYRGSRGSKGVIKLCGFVARDSWLTCNARPKSQHQAREAQEELRTSKGDMTELSVPGLHFSPLLEHGRAC